MVRKVLVLLVLMLVSLSGLAMAQDADAVATGLNNPRHITFGSDGTLYIAEAGKGGDLDAEGPFGPAKAGLTGQVSAVSSDGEQAVIIPELVSLDAGFGQVEGVMLALATDESYWLVLGMGPKEPIAEDTMTAAVVELDRETLDVKEMIDLLAFETENNPDQADELVSNPSDLAVAADGTLYIADASANSVLSWTKDNGLELFAAWPVVEGEPSAVPTSVAVGPDGDVYVGFLSGFPFPPQGARIERYSAGGELKETYSGLTLVTDILITADGTLYAVEMASGFGDAGYNADSGRVVTVSADGIEAVAEGLNIPYGMTQDADGNLYVTVDSAFAAPDSGRVIRVGGM